LHPYYFYFIFEMNSNPNIADDINNSLLYSP